ncbi:MAG: SRPBCC domain-containing protein [Granulosicoccus sp.]|nr:SRPBCC domain-containing protein [Granulosicoccus sp.]
MANEAVKPSVLVREFKAPRQLVFAAWTQVKHLNNWMFPMPGCKCEYVSANIVTGGKSLHKITMPDGNQMWLLTRYEEVVSPERLVFLQYFSNEQGDELSMPHIENWPKHMLATLSFEEIEENRTRLTFLWEPRNATEDEISVFESTRSDHDKGWGAGMEQLHNYIESITI